MARMGFLVVVACALAHVTGAEELGVFALHEIVPDVISAPPDSLLFVQFAESGVEVQAGAELLPSQVQGLPEISWDSEPDQYYTLCMTDPDAPSRYDASDREHRHWLVVNIPGGSVSAGRTLTEFLPSHPPPDSGLHRYTFLVYRQAGYIDEFDEPWLDDFNQRSRFSIQQFAQAHHMTGPVAGNFYTMQSEL